MGDISLLLANTFFSCYASYITPYQLCLEQHDLSIIPQIPEGQGTPSATLTLLPIIVITSNLPLVVKYCHLASDIPNFCERDAEFYLLIPPHRNPLLSFIKMPVHLFYPTPNTFKAFCTDLKGNILSCS